MKNLHVFCLLLFGIPVSVCQGADVKVVNNSGKEAKVAIAYWIQNNHVVVGWYTIRHGSNITLNRGSGSFFIRCEINNQEHRFNKAANSAHETFWGDPGRRFEGVIKYKSEAEDGYRYENMDSRDKKRIAGEIYGQAGSVWATRIPTTICWGNQGNYTGISRQKYTDSKQLGYWGQSESIASRWKKDVLELQRLGWKPLQFVEIPSNAKTVTIHP